MYILAALLILVCLIVITIMIVVKYLGKWMDE